MATIKEIAEKAKVSIGTVDRVIHNRGKVAVETEDKVKEIIESLNYQPNFFARNLKLQKVFTLGVVIPFLHLDSGYWEIVFNGIEKAKSELSGQKLSVKYFYYDKYSDKSINKISKEIFKKEIDGLLISPISTKTFKDFINKIPKQKPYIYLDANIPSTNNISYIGQAAYESGYLAGKLMCQLLCGNGSIAVLKVTPTDYHIEKRAEGFKEYFSDKEKCKIITFEIDGNADNTFYKNYFEKVILKNQSLKGIFVTNVSSHKIAEQIKNAKLVNKINLIGYDLVVENEKYLREGVIDYLISQSPEIQGYQGIYSLFKHIALNEKVKSKISMQIDIVTKENVNYYHSSQN